MTTVDRKEFIQLLDSVSPGISNNETVEQSSCFAFTGRRVMTFNDVMACTRESPVPLHGAVVAEPLMKLLHSIPEDDVEIGTSRGRFTVRTKKRRGSIRMDDEVVLPVDAVEEAEDWQPMPTGFAEACERAAGCVVKRSDKFFLRCIHLTPNYIEASDNYHMIRCRVKTGLAAPILLLRDTARHVSPLGMSEMSETDGWLHFRNEAGLVLSMRRYEEEYPKTAHLYKQRGTPTELPAGLADAAEAANIFSGNSVDNNYVTITIKPGMLRIRGEGAYGWYEERTKISYDGDQFQFAIAPRLLKEALGRARTVEINDSLLIIRTKKFHYMTCLGSMPGANAEASIDG